MIGGLLVGQFLFSLWFVEWLLVGDLSVSWLVDPHLVGCWSVGRLVGVCWSVG